MSPTLTAAMAMGFAVIHLFIGQARFLRVLPRSRWLSAGGGAAAAYIFIHVLPELATHQKTFREALGSARAEVVVYCLALVGLVVFYGLERLVRSERAREAGTEDAHAATDSSPRVFWIHIGSFALYNLLIGYLLVHREETGLVSLATYFVAMALHFTTNDFGLRQDHKASYDRSARWVIAGAVLVGWGLGVVTRVPEWAVGFLFAFLAGGVILNVLKEELPEERKSRFIPFLVGAAVCAALLLVEQPG